ncbi:MbtH family protein [Streptomyces erythrochromogenes]|uniref:MbtH family protein n=1 Tax=Streptomyces erythrochromogenes TaxID=285574 RepID=UPI0036B35C50|nr:MbtH family NRPS accessory protein [Streptomyces erythrochromogenes]
MNPFDNEATDYAVLVNDEGQYSLWPQWKPVPAGWSVSLERAGRQECLDHVDARWTDMRPASLVRWMRG